MKRFLILQFLPLIILVTAEPVHAVRPNIVFLLSDNQGWGDYGFMGHPHLQTPNLDQLARAGLVYERGYVTAPLCRPSLASIVTGMYPHQTGIRDKETTPWQYLSRLRTIAHGYLAAASTNRPNSLWIPSGIG
jgi:uncharacterized sulfatase